MSSKPQLPSSLADKRIAVPESRQLDILAELFERRGAHVVRIRFNLHEKQGVVR
ncbi:MAG: hypothetical protein QGG67_11805 [Gammaproteobacteria bacterium]|nr:hypothetical protein [Gammaproteobacteria bacterium]MDP7455329.1 hypothetical protein [Gammaproteobacteria bacterium]HJO12245.1 hypothetical protein [Gammaproteobacteria bacterium]